MMNLRVMKRGRRDARVSAMGMALLAVCAFFAIPGRAAAQAASPVSQVGLSGGLVVQYGAGDLQAATALSRTGRYLVHVLATSPAALVMAQTRCRAEGYYGLISVDVPARPDALPYADNLVNLIIIDEPFTSASELFRVVTPGGAVVVRHPAGISRADLESAGFSVPVPSGSRLVAHKLRPKGMDGWSHSRHGADGNAVSGDILVGSPEHIQWVAGAPSEVEGMVTAGGRNFYGGIMARDSFNGLRLWHRDLGRAESNAATFKLPRIARGRGRPVAGDALVFVAEGNALKALNAVDGQVVRSFPGVTRPTEIVQCGGSVIACDEVGVHAYRVDTAELLWTRPAAGPRDLAANTSGVSFMEGRLPRGETVKAILLEASSGEVRWQHSDYPWLEKVTRVVLRPRHLVYETSSLNDHDAGNAMYVVSPETGNILWEKAFPPGMNHNRQARAMFVGDDLWILHGGKINSADPEKRSRLPVQISALNPDTGDVRVTHPAGLTHCFPPVATSRFLLSGVMDLTDLQTGELFVNPITKANCSRENGWIPANGLIYTTPKHCTCWPILRGFTALASARAGAAEPVVTEAVAVLQRGGGALPADALDPTPADWPMYRNDCWRSSATTDPGPRKLDTLWSASLTDGDPVPAGPILHDWRENAFVKGPVSAPTVAYGRVYVTRPDAQEVVSLNADTGAVSWRFTADGRVDTPPTLCHGLCLFGSHAGSVYALRADTGELVWRFRAAPNDQRIVAYGQLESPWPVSGTVLVSAGVAYFAAGRQPLADGGIRIFAVDPLTGRRLWSHCLDSIPQKGYYENSGLEFDPFDILHKEGDGIALSRWIISGDGTTVKVDKWNAFAQLDPGGGAVWVPRGSWSYGPRHQQRFRGESPLRPLCAFRPHTVVSSLNGTTRIFRRDFDLEQGETFKDRWITGWEAAQTGSKGGNPFRTYRLAEKASWQADPYNPTATDTPAEPRRPGTQLHNNLYAMALTGGDRLFVIHRDGRLKAVALGDGSVLGETQVQPPAWDGLAIANQHLYLTTQSGHVVCIGN